MNGGAPTPILVIGHSGQVATALREAALRRGIDLVAAGRPEADLTKPDSIDALFKRAKADLVINAAAYTAVDKAESDPDLAFALNADGARYLAERAAHAGIPLLHLSTDYVYDGRKPVPYVEDDPTGPLSVYGRTKLEGEREILAVPGVQAVIFRTAWVYSPYGSNFVLTMLRLAREHGHVRVVADQLGNPTAAVDVAEALLDIAADMRIRGLAGRMGVYHLVGTGETSWAGFAEAIFAAGERLGLGSATVDRITTEDYPTPAPRPRNCRLSTEKLSRDWGMRLPNWRDSLIRCLAEVAAAR
jgi:dTDP-4-dehydrorhamnose reductase